MKGDTDNQLCAEVNERGCYLLEKAQYLDCRFLVGVEPHQEEIASHKLILAMASCVFEAMFYGDLSEKNNPVHIPDIQPETFKLLLQYIYTGNVNMNFVDEACNLYYAAKKYMLQHLLEECCRYLCDHVDTSNVWQLLEFAQHYEDKDLLLKCEKGVNAENGPEPVVENLNVGYALKQLESGAQAVDPGALAIKESAKIKGIIEKIRFLSLTPAEFAECSERTSILTMSEETAVIMNLASNKCNVPLPSHFSKCTFGRNFWRDSSSEKDDSRRAGSFTYTVYGFTDLDSVLSPPCYVLNLPWQLNVTKDVNGCPELSVQCSGLKNSNWSYEFNIVLRIGKIQPEFASSWSREVQNVFNATHLFCREHSAYFFSADTVNWTSYINRDGSVEFTVKLKEKNSRPRASGNLSDHRIITPVKKLRMM